MNEKIDWGLIIIVVLEMSLVLASIPRWVPALMLSEGLQLPLNEWRWWTPLSAWMNGGMAVAEAVSFAYVFHRLKSAKGRRAITLLILTFIMLSTFVGVLTPYVAASVKGVTINVILDPTRIHENWTHLLWGVFVVLLTASSISAVGYAWGNLDADVQVVTLDKVIETLDMFDNPVEARNWLKRQGIKINIAEILKLKKAERSSNNE